MSSRWSRVAVSARARASSAASHATTRTACRQPSTKAAYYRGRCLECHEQRVCALPAAERQARGPGEDCIACHMPRPAITNIPHTAATDHRIPRGVPGSLSGGPAGGTGSAGEISPAGLPLGPDDRGGTAGRRARPGRGPGLGRPDHERSPQLARVAATQALPLLEAAVRDRPRRPARPRISWACLRRSWTAPRTRFAPSKRSSASNRAASRPSGPPAACWPASNGPTSRVRRCKRRSRSTLGGRIIAWRWPGSAPRPATGPGPSRLAARRSGSTPSCSRRGRSWSSATFGRTEPEKADAEFQTLLRFYPASREVWQQWYEQQKQAGSMGADVPTSREP